MATETRERLIEAARECLLADGHGQLSTRRVAGRAGVPLSQIHYHFGGRQGLVLALLAHQNAQLLERQQSMYGADVPLFLRYEQACTFLKDDLASGYVRMLQEMIAAGWTDKVIGAEVTRLLRGWFDLLEQVVTEAADGSGTSPPSPPALSRPWSVSASWAESRCCCSGIPGVATSSPHSMPSAPSATGEQRGMKPPVVASRLELEHPKHLASASLVFSTNHRGLRRR